MFLYQSESFLYDSIMLKKDIFKKKIVGIKIVHPIHLHGHHFHVLKIGHPPFDPITGNSTAFGPDIRCLKVIVQKPHGRIPLGLMETFLALTSSIRLSKTQLVYRPIDMSSSDLLRIIQVHIHMYL